MGSMQMSALFKRHRARIHTDQTADQEGLKFLELDSIATNAIVIEYGSAEGGCHGYNFARTNAVTGSVPGTKSCLTVSNPDELKERFIKDCTKQAVEECVASPTCSEAVVFGERHEDGMTIFIRSQDTPNAMGCYSAVPHLKDSPTRLTVKDLPASYDPN